MTYHRPGTVAELLGIKQSTLRRWADEFTDALSPSAQSKVTELGTPGQRRFTDNDIAILREAKALLDAGRTYQETRQRLIEATKQAESANEPITESAIELATADKAMLMASYERVIEARDRELDALKAQQQELLAAKDEVIDAKDETIDILQKQVDELKAELAKSRVPWWKKLRGV